jgi:ABC-type branched-subunit amino acid transport system substrate-binding protein
VNTKRRWIRLLAALGVFALLAAACGDDDTETDTTTATTDDGGTEDGTEAEDDGGEDDGGDDEGAAEEPELPDEPEVSGEAGEGLTVGYVLPQDGPLGFLGPPQIEGVKLAIEDINDAGGVLDTDVALLEGNEGASPQWAAQSVDGLLAAGANVIVGAAASSFSQGFIDTLYQQEIPQCSASNTSTSFTEQANAEYYIRTVPPDEAVVPIIADYIIADGHESVVIIARADDYGEVLADLSQEALEGQGVEIVDTIMYNPEADNHSTEADQAAEAGADAVLLIAFDEGGPIVARMLEGGVQTEQLYGGDGVFGPTFIEQVDPNDSNVIDGMTVIGAAGDEQFNERIAEPTDNSFIYGGQAYDCTILFALAVEQVGDVSDGAGIVEAAIEISGGDGEACTSYEECVGMIREGQSVNYDGASGAIELDEVGDPTAGRYAIGRFVDGAIEIIASEDV